MQAWSTEEHRRNRPNSDAGHQKFDEVAETEWGRMTVPPSPPSQTPQTERPDLKLTDGLESHRSQRTSLRESKYRSKAVLLKCILLICLIWTVTLWNSSNAILRTAANNILHEIQDWLDLKIHSPSPESEIPQKPIAAPDVSLVPFTFQPLPLGSIKPLGWINDQMNLMSNGLAGHQYDFYHIVEQSPWLGGYSEYSVLNEGFPYWLNGLVPLAYGLNDRRLILQVEDASDYILNHQQLDGWLGPEPVGERDLWGRFPLFLGLWQLVEAEPNRAPKIIPAMHSFVNLMNSMLVDNTGFEEIWGRVRYPDMLMTLQWLYENYPEGNQQTLLETMYLLRSRGLEWSSWWTNGTYIFADLDTVQPPITDQSPEYAFTHGVNAAQGLKAGAAIYRYTADTSLLDNNRNGVNWTFTYHGDPAGSIIGDERLSGVNANRGSELCTAVETMYSMSYLYQSMGDNYFADRCELAAFNALPVSITGDHWGRQYLALASEPYSRQLNGPNPFFNVGEYGIVYGMEPNYPCCTVNMPQGLPKFLSASYMLSGDNGIVHAMLGPAQVTATTPLNTTITIVCNTNYPFSPDLYYDISASAAFTLYLRVPSWYVPANSSISLNDNGAEYPLDPDPHTGLTPINLSAGNSTVKYTLGASIQVLPRANSTVAVYHGSLLYALDVGQTETILAPDLYNVTYANGTGDPYDTSAPSLPPEVHDFAFTNSTPWNIAIDPSTLTFHTTANGTNETALPNPIFEYGAPPTYITGKGCQIDWPLYNGLPAPLPALPNGTTNRVCTGNLTDVVLRPYGSLKIHMAELPIVDLTVNISSRPTVDSHAQKVMDLAN
ncbi:hypothetical protein ACLMJK_000839 [Lecanora helva]